MNAIPYITDEKQNEIIGQLIAQEKYKFAPASLIAEVVRDTVMLLRGR